MACASGLLTVLQMAMLARAVIGWFPGLDGTIVSEVAYVVTEPFVMPVRKFLDRFEAIRNFPIDLSFFVAFMIISFVATVLFS